MKRSLLIGMLTATVLWGCGREPVQAPLQEVFVQVETEAPTKAGAADGSAITNVLLLMVQDGVLAAEPVYYEVAEGVASMKVDCGLLAVGSYKLYAYGNIQHADWLDSGVNATEKTWTKGTAFQPDRLMKTLTGTATPGVPVSAMLLTGSSTLLVDITDNVGNVTLTRPIMRLNVLVNNHAEADITVSALTFSDFNPSTGYLVPHADAAGNMTLPAVTYRSLPPFTGSRTISANTDETIYSTLLYESRAPSYSMSATVTMTPPGGGTLTRYLTNATLQMIDADTSIPAPLTEMRRNQDLTVVLNVFYQELAGTITVTVDNTYWTESGGHTSSHQFN